MTNISPKKVYQHTSIDGEASLAEGSSKNPGLTLSSSLDDPGPMSRTTTHRNFIGVKNDGGEDLEWKDGSVKYIDLTNWWKTHKNSAKKEANDLVPIGYEDKTSWELITNSILAPTSAEGRSWWREIENYRQG